MKTQQRTNVGKMTSSRPQSTFSDTSATLQVYIRGDNEFWAIVPNVTLLNGCIPCVEDEVTGLPLDEQELPRIEPASWFKVFIFDSVSIDCVHHTVRWNCDSAVSTIHEAVTQMTSPPACKDRRHRLTQCLFVDVESREDEMGQLFTEVETIVNEFKEGLLAWGNFKKEVIRLLHCHVLPSIPIKQRHLPLLASAYTRQSQYIHQVDADIVKKYDIVDNINKALSRLMLTISDDPRDLVNLPVDFAKTFHDDIKKEMEQSRAFYEQLQQNAYSKQQIADGSSALKAYVPVDEHFKQLKLQEAHFALRDSLERKSSDSRLSLLIASKHNSQKALCVQYLGMRQEITLIKSEIKTMVERKVLMMSVKEAIRMTMKKLEEGQECAAVRDMTSPATDVLPNSDLSREWLTLSERISIILQEIKHPLAVKHRTFCAHVVDRCKATLLSQDLSERERVASGPQDAGDTATADDGTNTSCCGIAAKDEEEEDSDLDDIFEESLKRKERHASQRSIFDGSVTLCIIDGKCKRSSGDSFQWQVSSPEAEANPKMWLPSQSRAKAKDVYRANCALMALKHSVQEHVRHMAKFLHLEIDASNTDSYKQIWLHYESHFYPEVFPELIRLYSAAYSPMCERMRDDYPTMTLVDLDLENSILTAMMEEERKTFEEVSGDQQAVYNATYPMRAEYGSGLSMDSESNVGAILQNVKQERGASSLPDVTFEETPSGDLVLHTKRQRLFCAKKTTRLRSTFQDRFTSALENINMAIKSETPYMKLKYLMKSLTEINKELGVFQSEYSGKRAEVSNMVHMLVILLCNTEIFPTVDLYPQLVLLADILPPFFEGGQYSFFILQLLAAYQLIEDSLYTKRLEEEEETQL